MSRSENGAPSASWPVGVRWRAGTVTCELASIRKSWSGASTDRPAVGDAGGDDDVVAGADRQAPEHALEHGGARLHVGDLVADGVAVQRAGPGRGRGRDGEAHVVVAEQGRAPVDGVAARGQLAGAQVVRRDRQVRGRAQPRCVPPGRCARARSASGGGRAGSTGRRTPPRRPTPPRPRRRRRRAGCGACGARHRPVGSTSALLSAFPGHAGRCWPLLGWRLVARTPTTAVDPHPWRLTPMGRLRRYPSPRRTRSAGRRHLRTSRAASPCRRRRGTSACCRRAGSAARRRAT